jgi:hypothetical protein
VECRRKIRAKRANPAHHSPGTYQVQTHIPFCAGLSQRATLPVARCQRKRPAARCGATQQCRKASRGRLFAGRQDLVNDPVPKVSGVRPVGRVHLVAPENPNTVAERRIRVGEFYLRSCCRIWLHASATFKSRVPNKRCLRQRKRKSP